MPFVFVVAALSCRLLVFIGIFLLGFAVMLMRLTEARRPSKALCSNLKAEISLWRVCQAQAAVVLP
jgi:hypothetical protein